MAGQGEEGAFEDAVRGEGRGLASPDPSRDACGESKRCGRGVGEQVDEEVEREPDEDGLVLHGRAAGEEGA